MKKKKKKEAAAAPPADEPAPEPVNSNFSPSEGDPPADTGTKKNKKKKGDDAATETDAFGEPVKP